MTPHVSLTELGQVEWCCNCRGQDAMHYEPVFAITLTDVSFFVCHSCLQSLTATLVDELVSLPICEVAKNA